MTPRSRRTAPTDGRLFYTGGTMVTIQNPYSDIESEVEADSVPTPTTPWNAYRAALEMCRRLGFNELSDRDIVSDSGGFIVHQHNRTGFHTQCMIYNYMQITRYGSNDNVRVAVVMPYGGLPTISVEGFITESNVAAFEEVARCLIEVCDRENG